MGATITFGAILSLSSDTEDAEKLSRLLVSLLETESISNQLTKIEKEKQEQKMKTEYVK